MVLLFLLNPYEGLGLQDEYLEAMEVVILKLMLVDHLTQLLRND
jgi:hypothetical protein